MIDWYGERSPTFTDMEAWAQEIGIQVAFHWDFDVPRYFWDEDGDPWFIGIPEQFGTLARCWALAHELGHMVCHGGPPKSHVQHQAQEEEADQWASCAMIPNPVVRDLPELSVHKLVKYLHDNFQDFGGKGDRVRALAYRIAYTRLKAFEEVA